MIPSRSYLPKKTDPRPLGVCRLSAPDCPARLRILTRIGTANELRARGPGDCANLLNYHCFTVGMRRNGTLKSPIHTRGRTPTRVAGVLIFVACMVGHVPCVRAQGIEITPIGGYRFGGDFFELVTAQPVDLDGAPALGVVVNVPGEEGLQFEAAFSHQLARVSTPTRPFEPARLWRISVDHYQVGALQEFRRGRMRPFLTGILGLTRYAADSDGEIRFLTAAGGGVKLFPFSHVGLRLESRVFATFVDADDTFIACAGGACLFAIDTEIVWQAEFTAGLVLRFP